MTKDIGCSKVSIIVPNYNHASYLEQRLESILNQTYQDFEIILLDDASTDGSQEILQRYAKHPKVTQLVLNDFNSGSVFKQWVKGLKLVKGDFVWIAESDDFADITFLKKTLPILEDDSNVGLVFTDTQKVSETGAYLKRVSESKKPLRDLVKEGCVINRSNLTNYLLRKMVIVNASSVLFKKEAILSVDFERLEYFKYVGDTFVYLQIGLAHDIKFLNKPLNSMRLHRGNTTKKGKKGGRLFMDKLILLDCNVEAFKKTGASELDVLEYFYSIFFVNLDNQKGQLLKQLQKKLLSLGFLNKAAYYKVNFARFFYKILTNKGRPGFIRKLFKEYMRNTLKLD